ncbi:MAG TPA: hypothetical protein DF712_18850 [Balneola sp.]|nr:hypothetical protein [Balneola sp.]
MKISKNTLSILKNFRDLNSNILISKGSLLKTLTPAKNVMSSATVTESFPVEFGLWDLTSFLGTVSLFEDPDFNFKDKYVDIVGSNGSTVKYFYSEPSLLTVPTKDVKMPESVVSIELTEEAFSELKKAAAVLNLSDLSICSTDGSSIVAILSDIKNNTSNTYSIDIGYNESGNVFNFDFKIDNLRIIPGNYDVSFAEKIVSQFSNKNLDLNYWIALESSSSFTSTVGSNIGVS